MGGIHAVRHPTPRLTSPTERAPWWRRHIRVEDVVLAVWLIAIAPLLSSNPGSAPSGGPDPILGLLDMVGLLAFAACLGARSQPDVDSGVVAGTELRYAVGPLFGALAFTLDDVRARLGLDGGLALLPIVAAGVVALVARFRLGPLAAVQRRALVTPFVLVTSRFFGDVVGGFTDLFDLRQLAAAVIAPGGAVGTVFVVGIAILGVALFYVMLVFAPRQIAEREGSPGTWAVRFLVFVVSLALGQTLAGMVHPI
jgi:hypothetical protein